MIDVSAKVREAGVVGAGGAGFPTHLKISAKAEIVLVNGAECEPLLKSDQQLAAQYPEKIVRGLSLAMESTGANKGIIALKGKYKEAIKALKPCLGKTMEIAILPDIYPAGDEVVAIWLTTGRRVPPGGIPLAIGVVVNNIQTMINIAQAAEGIPVTTRTLTVTGAVSKPITLTVPLGTRLNDVLALAGDQPRYDLAYIVGGPVMGSLASDLDQPVTKTTGALIALPADHPLVLNKQKPLKSVLQIAKTACEQCSFCTELCPRHLLGHALAPHLLIRAVNYNLIGSPELITSALLCSECGVCEVYACPVGISPRRVNVELKGELRAKGIKYSGFIGKVDLMTEYRLIPSARLIQRLGLNSWYREAPLQLEIFEPKEVVLKLQQHVGVPAKPVVNLGDNVIKGQVIAEIPEGAWGARIHASISGTVTSITSQAITIGKSGAAL